MDTYYNAMSASFQFLMHPLTQNSRSPTQAEDLGVSQLPHTPSTANLETANVTTDSAGKQNSTPSGMQLSQLCAILKHNVLDIIQALLLPGMLCTFSETWLGLIRRVRQLEESSGQTVPIASRSTPVVQNLTAGQSLKEMLVEISSLCDRARYAGIGTLCGALLVFMLVLQVAVRLVMVYIVIVCLATIYILSIVEDLAQSLLYSGPPYTWSDDNDKLIAIVLAFPKPFPMLCTIVAGVSAIIAMMSGVNYSPEEVFCLLRGDLSQTQQMNESITSSEPPPPWLYILVACMLVAEISQCALIRNRLRKLLRSGYYSDGEQCPQTASLQTTGHGLVRSSPSQTSHSPAR